MPMRVHEPLDNHDVSYRDRLYVLQPGAEEYGEPGDIIVLREHDEARGWVFELIDAGVPTGRAFDLSMRGEQRYITHHLDSPALVADRETGERFITVYDHAHPEDLVLRSADYTKKVVPLDEVHTYRCVENGWRIKPVVIIDVFYRSGEGEPEQHETHALTAHRRVKKTCRDLVHQLEDAGCVDVRVELTLSTLL